MQKATPPDQTETTTYVVLPKAAKHASRRHCTIAFHGESFSIIAFGQNGVLLDGQTLSNGEAKTLSLASCAGSFLLGFYSEIEVTIREAADTSAGDRDQAISARGDLVDPTSEATQMLDLPSSPLSEAEPSRRTSPEPRPVKRVKRDSGFGRLSRASSEVALPSSDPYAHQEDNGYPPESEDESEDADEDDASRIAKLAQDGEYRQRFKRKENL
jgi:predicted component of type VI protein secretion system